MKKPNAAINKKLKSLRKDVELILRRLEMKVPVKKDLAMVPQDLEDKFRRLALEAVKSSQDVKELKPVVSEIREGVWTLLARIDSLGARLSEIAKKANSPLAP